jgi:hypothetical protein
VIATRGEVHWEEHFGFDWQSPVFLFEQTGRGAPARIAKIKIAVQAILEINVTIPIGVSVGNSRKQTTSEAEEQREPEAQQLS